MQTSYLLKVHKVKHIHHQEIVHSNAKVKPFLGGTQHELPHPSLIHGITQKQTNKKLLHTTSFRVIKKSFLITPHFVLTSKSTNILLQRPDLTTEITLLSVS